MTQDTTDTTPPPASPDQDQVMHDLTVKSLIAYTLRVRASTTRGAPADAAAIRAGLTPATEQLAFGRTEPHLTGLPAHARAGARRAAAICAAATNAPQTSGENTKHWKVGNSLRDLYNKENGGTTPDPGNGIVQAVNTLPLLDNETAAATFAMLIQRCSGHGIPVNFYDLAATLTFWGNGISPRSVMTREQVVASFYQHTTPAPTPATTKE